MKRFNLEQGRGAILGVTFMASVLYGGYFFYNRAHPCDTPITYKIGTLDPRFGVSQADFMRDINQAGNIWSASIGKQLFKYDPKGELTINLVYDTRQAATQQEQRLGANIQQNTQVANSVKQQYAALYTQYQNLQKQYTSELAQFNASQNSYNNEVQYWNANGGASQAEYAQLQSKKAALLHEQNVIESKRLQVNTLASQVNALIDKYNLVVDHINNDVKTINSDGLVGTQFEEGVYVYDASGMRINIYQFDNQTYFLRVLAHELGHALNLDHNNNPASIMNPVNQSPKLALTQDDLKALKTECGI
jgi:hypothetical protein